MENLLLIAADAAAEIPASNSLPAGKTILCPGICAFGDARVTALPPDSVILQTGYITSADKPHAANTPPDAIKKFNGSFALIKVDTANHVITVFSDRWASRPLWYYHQKGTWYIASNLRYITDASGCKLPIDAANFASLLMRGRPVDNGTMLSGIRRTRPGEAVTLHTDGKISIKQWYALKYEPDSALSRTDAAQVLAEHLKNAATNILSISRNPVLFLSGGMDSRLTLAAFPKAERPVCITLADRQNYEASIAGKVAAAAVAKERVVLRDKHWYLRDLENFILFSGGCYHFAHAHFSQACRTPGIGGSSFMMGDWMEPFQKVFYKGNVQFNSPETLLEQLPVLDGYYANQRRNSCLQIIKPEYRAAFHAVWRERMLAKAAEAIAASPEIPTVCEYFIRTNSAYEHATYAMHENIRMAGEEYALFWDNDISDLLFSLPYELRANSNLACDVLNLISPELMAIANANTMLPPSLPPVLAAFVMKLRGLAGAARKKLSMLTGSRNYSHLGSWPNLHLLCATDPEWTKYIENTIFRNNSLPDFIDTDYAKTVWARFHAGQFEYAYELYALLNLAIINSSNGTGHHEL